ncbi:hypothetical protein C9J12_28800 [Photobacterium frigidiphilum]|uniref:Uncharacterized protein n=1 Tax=Photobacterium frigidiphilum TaxID=264736 RepID=A0A2T3J639_9GAMM|nr:hypothetical protein [Photobacterium frigidiphilum]PSU42631.1 hypothetical protein C9J12_28800 [Photobacterium frigidiphilum]
MNLSRNSIRKSEQHVKKDPTAFIEGADDTKQPEPIVKPAGRPKTNKELTKPVSISLTKTDQVKLDNQAKRYNMLSYQRDNTSEINLNRSDIVRLMANYLNSMEDSEYLTLINKIIR